MLETFLQRFIDVIRFTDHKRAMFGCSSYLSVAAMHAHTHSLFPYYVMLLCMIAVGCNVYAPLFLTDHSKGFYTTAINPLTQ